MGDDLRIRKLLAELAADRDAWARQRARWQASLVSAPWAPEQPELFRAAVALHHGYAAMESAFERIARSFEGPPEAGARWHVGLLNAMSLSIPEVRPAVLGAEATSALRDALAFRHFFRHAYAVELDPARVARAAADLEAAAALIDADLDAFEAHLRALLPAPTP